MHTQAVNETPKYPAPFVAEVHFRKDSKWYDKHEKYFFRSDKISPHTVNNHYLNYLEVEKFVQREINKTIVSAVIWNNTGVGKKKVYERTENTILLPRQVSVDWFIPTYTKNLVFDGVIYTNGIGQWLNEKFEFDQHNERIALSHHTEVYEAYRKLLTQKNAA